MNRRRTSWLGAVLLAAAIAAGRLAGRFGPSGPARPGSQFELSDAVQLDQVDNAVRAQLDRVKALLADRQWDEAIEFLRQLAETSEGKLLDVAPHRFIGSARLVPVAVGRPAARGA